MATTTKKDTPNETTNTSSAGASGKRPVPAASDASRNKEKSSRRRKQGLLCDELSFAAAESYKLLRTNLLFSLPDQECRVIGVTSSVRGEGKSTTAVNLSYTLAQTGKRVLLIDGDMRLPTIAQKMNMSAAPGLSNLLAGLSSERSCLRKSGYFDNWYILPSGDVPPNPSELLGSERMHALLERYKDVFDYILLDLPPVNIVVDALVITKWTDGIMVVVRENYSDRRALDSCMYQIDKLGVKMLGFVMTDSNVSSSSYKHYGKYGKRYGYGYGYDGKSRKKDAAVSSAKNQAFLKVTSEDASPYEDQTDASPDGAETVSSGK